MGGAGRQAGTQGRANEEIFLEMSGFAVAEERESVPVREGPCTPKVVSPCSLSPPGLLVARGSLSRHLPLQPSCLPGCLAADWMFCAEFKESKQAQC